MEVVDHIFKDVLFLESPNIGTSIIEPKYIILHYDASGNEFSAINWMLSTQSKVSAHLHISRDGDITQLARFNSECWHAGESSWKEDSNLNRCSIGIELQNTGDQHYTFKQLFTTFIAINTLMENYSIIELLGHSDVSPKRKIDPGNLFPMQDFKDLLGL